MFFTAIAFFLGVACVVVAQRSDEEIPIGHTFIYQPAEGEMPERVQLAGSFNEWSSANTPMVRSDDGTWRVTLDLPDGLHQYKFVINGTQWVNDPSADKDLDALDGQGGVNSVVLIGFDIREIDPPVENAINALAVSHNPEDPADQSAASREFLVLSVRAQAGDVQEAYVLIYGTVKDWVMQRVPLPLHRTLGGFDRFRAVIEVAGEVQYRIELVDGDAKITLPRDEGFFEAPMADGPMTPDWAKHAIWYQVFPERFRNGEPANDPGAFWYERPTAWTSDWWATLPGEARAAENFYQGEGNVWRRRYGGDLQGLQEKLPYLRELGINAIYLNPVFEAESMHKYDTADYRHVDDNFGVRRDTPFVGLPGETGDPDTWQWTGSDQVFLDFIKEAHAQGFKVIVDGVFNHVGTAHPFFQDVLKQGQDSPYAQWFEITDWGDPQNWGNVQTQGKPGGIQWAAWDQPNGALPVFKKNEETGLAEGPRQHILDITTRWMDPNGDGDPSDGIDGWRLDVPNDIPHPFWIDWCAHVRNLNSDAYITGEIWSWAHAWLQGDQFDAVMNYRFADASQAFFIDQDNAIPPSEFAARLDDLAYRYPLQVAFAMQNLMDSHDTDRLASMFVNPDRAYDTLNRPQDNGPGYDPRALNREEQQRMRQLVAFQMAFVGAPMIYYGDEAGMWGPDDPSNRMPMVWKDLEPYDGKGVAFNEEMFEWYQHCIAVRNLVPALRTGAYRTVLADDEKGVLVFERSLGNQSVYVVINRSSRRRSVTFDVNPALAGRSLNNLLNTVEYRINTDDSLRPTLNFRESHRHANTVIDYQLWTSLSPYEIQIFIDPRTLNH